MGSRRFGRYRLIERLGQGRQGQVWKAVQSEPIVETIALKLLSRDLSLDPKRLAQFHREAEVGAQLESPSLLPTYEFGAISGIPFMTMPLVNGDSLDEVIRQRNDRGSGRRSVAWSWWSWLSAEAYHRSVVRVMARIARALEVAHVNQVVHRDIKPANILLDRHREDHVYLCDFGLSRDLDSPPADSTCFGTGTPLYMAPEKLMGQRVDDVRCDVYALGVTLFEALTGVHPYSIPDDVAPSQWAAFLAVATPRTPRPLDSRISRVLEKVVLKAMHRDPDRRYTSASALAADLERLATRPSGL